MTEIFVFNILCNPNKKSIVFLSGEKHWILSTGSRWSLGNTVSQLTSEKKPIVPNAEKINFLHFRCQTLSQGKICILFFIDSCFQGIAVSEPYDKKVLIFFLMQTEVL